MNEKQINEMLNEARDCINKAVLHVYKARDIINDLQQRMRAPKQPALIFDISTGKEVKKLPPAPCEGE